MPHSSRVVDSVFLFLLHFPWIDTCETLDSIKKLPIEEDIVFSRANRMTKMNSPDAISRHLVQESTTAECLARYGETEMKLPPLLYTFPGSGNTWCRLLIERATGVLSGSLYDDSFLEDLFPGELVCNQSQSVIKAHPETFPFGGLLNGKFRSHRNKCNSPGQMGNVTHFERAILLIRNPFDAIWAEYQRKAAGGSHVGGVPRKVFSRDRWNASAINSARLYAGMMSRHYKALFEAFGPDNYELYRFEDLKNQSQRLSILSGMVKFIGLETYTSQHRLQCAFLLAESRSVHRVIANKDFVSKEEAYTSDLVCQMWQIFGVHVEKYGYEIWNHTDCSYTSYGPTKGNKRYVV